ncbi:hypothetical protein C2W62_33290 [Candidatus Entotheonella serta]|nr:hypothetical protein C2W62_33290 [Candidatus Entotheonella serta]
MQRRFLTLAISLFVFTASLVPSASAGQTEREAALFIRNALDATTPYSYWSAIEAKTPTIFFYMQHRVWHDGSPIMRHEGKKLLSCVASMLSALRN